MASKLVPKCTQKYSESFKVFTKWYLQGTVCKQNRLRIFSPVIKVDQNKGSACFVWPPSVGASFEAECSKFGDPKNKLIEILRLIIPVAFHQRWLSLKCATPVILMWHWICHVHSQSFAFRNSFSNETTVYLIFLKRATISCRLSNGYFSDAAKESNSNQKPGFLSFAQSDWTITATPLHFLVLFTCPFNYLSMRQLN